MTTRKLAVALAAGLSLVTALTGCSTSSTSNPSTAGAAPAKDTTATLNIWGYVDQKITPWIGRETTAFKNEYPNVTVNYTYVPYDQMAAKVLGTAVAGGGPDGIFYNPSDAAQLSQSGVLADMTPYLSAFPDASQIPSSVVWKDQEKIVSIQGYVNTTALFYNKTILDKLGLTPPQTVAQLDSDLKAVAAAGYGGMTMCAAPTAESEFQIFPWMLGEGQNYGSFTTSGVSAVFSQFSSWIHAGYIPKDVVNWTQGDAWDKFSAGQYAFTQNGNWLLGRAAKLPFEWGVVPIPAGSAGSHSVGGGEGFSIGAKSSNPALTWQFLQEALLSKTGELSILKDAGSLPVRADAATAPELKSDPALAVFADIVKNMIARPGTPKISGDLVAMGKIWNSVAAGIDSPDVGAQQVVEQLNNVK